MLVRQTNRGALTAHTNYHATSSLQYARWQAGVVPGTRNGAARRVNEPGSPSRKARTSLLNVRFIQEAQAGTLWRSQTAVELRKSRSTKQISCRATLFRSSASNCALYWKSVQINAVFTDASPAPVRARFPLDSSGSRRSRT